MSSADSDLSPFYEESQSIYDVSNDFFAVFLGYGTQLVAMILFYIVASLWFHFRRYRYVSRAAQFTMPWPRPEGY